MIICPCCGYQISEKRKPLKKPRRRRLPNGFGSITELRGRRLSNPYYVRITIGKDASGRPVLKPLRPKAYFKTYNDAYSALIKYNENPYDLDKDMIVKDLFDLWLESIKENVSIDRVRSLISAFAYCGDMYQVRVRDIRARHIKHCIDNGYVIIDKGKDKGSKRHTTPYTKDRIKGLWNGMLDYALEYELVDKNYARTFSLPSKMYEEARNNKREHLAFSQEEIAKLWSLRQKEAVVSLILIQCYTGMRPNELLKLSRTNINLEERTIKGGSKTEAGRDRIIPIHSAILPLVQSHYETSEKLDSPTLFNTTDSRKSNKRNNRWSYHVYRNHFLALMEKYHFDPAHRPHDPRKTFVTEAKRAGLDDNVIKILVGHAINDLTESVYTSRDIEWLRADLEKIKAPV